MNTLQAKGLDQFGKTEQLFFGAGIPSQEGDEIEQRFFEITFVDVILRGYVTLTLGDLILEDLEKDNTVES
ncbi:MAG: hypothetical protein AAB802_05235, partial [Patescibacteria group bacterium]